MYYNYHLNNPMILVIFLLFFYLVLLFNFYYLFRHLILLLFWMFDKMWVYILQVPCIFAVVLLLFLMSLKLFFFQDHIDLVVKFVGYCFVCLFVSLLLFFFRNAYDLFIDRFFLLFDIFLLEVCLIQENRIVDLY